MTTVTERATSARDRVTIWVSDWPLLSEVTNVLRLIQQIDHRTTGMMLFGRGLPHPYGRDPIVSPGLLDTPSIFLLAFEDSERFRLRGAHVAKASFASPGFITIDGSGALEKLIDILHSGRLQNEERVALIERIRAETARIQADSDLIRTQVRAANITALREAITVLEALAYTPDEIRTFLVNDHRLQGLLGEPLVSFRQHQEIGVITAVAKGDAERER